MAVKVRWWSILIPTGKGLLATRRPEVRNGGLIWLFQFFPTSEVSQRPSKGMCVGEARRMGALGPEVLYSSSNDFLVTRTWVTLSPSEFPTCLDWPNCNSWNNSRCMATLFNHRRQWRKTPRQSQPDNRLFWILPSALPVQDTCNGDGHCARECCSGGRGSSRQRKSCRLRANGNALPGPSFFLVSLKIWGVVMVTDNLDSAQLLSIIIQHQCFSFLSLFFFFKSPLLLGGKSQLLPIWGAGNVDRT